MARAEGQRRDTSGASRKGGRRSLLLAGACLIVALVALLRRGEDARAPAAPTPAAVAERPATAPVLPPEPVDPSSGSNTPDPETIPLAGPPPTDERSALVQRLTREIIACTPGEPVPEELQAEVVRCLIAQPFPPPPAVISTEAEREIYDLSRYAHRRCSEEGLVALLDRELIASLSLEEFGQLLRHLYSRDLQDAIPRDLRTVRADELQQRLLAWTPPVDITMPLVRCLLTDATDWSSALETAFAFSDRQAERGREGWAYGPPIGAAFRKAAREEWVPALEALIRATSHWETAQHGTTALRRLVWVLDSTLAAAAIVDYASWADARFVESGARQGSPEWDHLKIAMAAVHALTLATDEPELRRQWADRTALLLASPEPRLRRDACSLLAAFLERMPEEERTSSLASLRLALSDEDPDVALAAARAIADCDPDWRSTLTRLNPSQHQALLGEEIQRLLEREDPGRR